MVKVSEVYSSGSNYINADSLKGRRVTARIAGVAQEVLGPKRENKLVLDMCSTDGKPWPKRFILNPTNAGLLTSAMGDETDDWIGRTISLWPEQTSFQGKPTMGIRVAVVGNAAAPPPAAPSWAEHDAPAHDDLGDEIPF